MPISRAEPPPGLEQAVLDTAAELLPSRLGATGGQGPTVAGEVPALASTTAISDVWPLYHLGLQQIVDGSGLGGAEFIGWRALLRVSGRPAAIADVDPDAGGSQDVRQLSYGPVVSGITSAAESPRPGGADDPDDIDERILQIPGIYVVAMWEHNESRPDADVVTPTDPAPPELDASRRYDAAEFLAAVTPLASARAGDDPTRAPGSGSGEPPPP